MIASSNLARADKITPRWPVRADSRARFQTLVSAVGRLLTQYGPSEITIQMIAEAVQMPSATVYHFFPSAEAALVAQAQIYISEFETMAGRETQLLDRTSWQRSWRAGAQRGREVFVADAARMRLLLGADVPADVQNVDAEFNIRLGRIIAAQFERETYLAPTPGLAEAFTHAVEISDTFWRLSFRRTGTITDYYFDEGMRAVIAYLSTYLPEQLEYRPL
ncbi:MAG: TetR/AcrR family transcriptional regulator [Alphaproteobacteria bacterium]|nr:TetR/AcrR family transcriptional regulator [Alphaproteobacteria bacterium]